MAHVANDTVSLPAKWGEELNRKLTDHERTQVEDPHQTSFQCAIRTEIWRGHASPEPQSPANY